MEKELREKIRDILWENGCDIEDLGRETDKTMAAINRCTDTLVNEKTAKVLPEIKEKASIEALKQVRAEYRIAEGVKIGGLSPFISETIIVSGEELNRNHFIPDRGINDPLSEDVRLFFDDLTERWLVRIKNGTPKLISHFVVIACLIIDASGPGKCRAFVVFLKGEAKPLIFWKGIIEAAELRKQTQFHKKGLSYARKDLYHESFMRALSMCSSVYFLTLPRHAGWNWTPEGSRIFVDSEMMQPQFEDLFLTDDHEDTKKKGNKMHNVFLDVSLSSTDRKFDDVVAYYHSLIPDTLPMKIGTVISAMSRLLPFYKEEGLVQDRLLLFETADDATAKTMTAVIKNRHHLTTEALFSSMRLPYLEEEIKKYVDCTAVLRHSCAICTMHDFIKILKFLFELIQNGYADEGGRRLVPVLFIDNAGVVPEEFLIHQISISDRIHFDNVEQIQGILGVLDYHIVKNTERNPDAVQQSLKAAITTAKEMVYTFPRRSQSSSAVMLLSTAIMLKEGGVLTDADVQEIQEWLFTEAKSRTSMSSSVYKATKVSLSNAICSGVLQIANQYGPPFWSTDRAFIASDDSLNITKETLADEILPELPVGKKNALDYLEEEDVLYHDEGKGKQKTWTVETEDGKKKPRRFYSLSRDLLTPEANKIVDEATASDLFHKIDAPINNFFPFIKHRRLEMFAGQQITDYKHGNNFIAVTGAPGAGKTDWLMMQAIQRAKAGDVVVVADPTNSFCKEELSGHKIPDEIINELFEFWDMSNDGFPVSIPDYEGCSNLQQQVQRLSSLLISGMHVTGPQQRLVLTSKVFEWLETTPINNSIDLASLPASLGDTRDEKELYSKMKALFSTVDMYKNVPFTWADRLYAKGKILVISSGNANINEQANPFDVVLDTLYSYKDIHHDDRVTIILDEFQTLNRHRGCTLESILSRGRKLNMSVILASQEYTDKKDSIGRFYAYCGTRVFFRPLGEECVKVIAELTKLDANIIRTLPDFNCAVLGPIYSEYYQKNIQLKSAIVGETYRPPYVGSYDDEEQP